MAAISHVFTIRRAAQILVRDEDLLWELSDQLEPEDGKLWVYAIDGAETPAFMASRLFAKLSRIRSIAPVNLKTSVPRCSAYAYVVSTANERAHQIAGGLSCCYWLSAIHISPTISTQATTESPSIISPLITLLPGVRVGPPCWWVVGGRVGAQTRRQ